MSIYADSSFVISVYVSDAHSSKADQRLAVHRGLWLTPLHRAELAQALEQNVFRGQISAEEAGSLYQVFEQDRRNGIWIETGLPEMAFETSIVLARQHVARIGARTLDTLHVASALELKAQRFWTFDQRQAKLAKAVGLEVS